MRYARKLFDNLKKKSFTFKKMYSFNTELKNEFIIKYYIEFYNILGYRHKI